MSYGEVPQQNLNYRTLAELAPPGTRENWYMSPTGSSYEMNNTGLSGSGTAWGPKMSIAGCGGEKMGITLLIFVVMGLLLAAVFIKE